MLELPVCFARKEWTCSLSFWCLFLGENGNSMCVFSLVSADSHGGCKSPNPNTKSPCQEAMTHHFGLHSTSTQRISLAKSSDRIIVAKIAIILSVVN